MSERERGEEGRERKRERGEGRERGGEGRVRGWEGGRGALLWEHNYLKSHFYFRSA